jgi:hypothetical protein
MRLNVFKHVEKYKWRWTRRLGRHRVLADSRLDNELFAFFELSLVACMGFNVYWFVCLERVDYT